MTIALSMHVNDGIVLASDSASSIWARGPVETMVGVVNIYEHADKVFNLYKGLPIGAITWGSGSIGLSSVSTLTKDFRRSLLSDLDKDSYTIEDVANKLTHFMFEKHYAPAYSKWSTKPDLGFMVAGYSAGKDYAEEWKVDVASGHVNGPTKIRGEGESGMTWNGQPEAVSRLYFGYAPALPAILEQAGLDKAKIDEIITAIRQQLIIPFVLAPMPIQDAIDLAVFFVQLTIQVSKFSPGAPTVGGPVDVAVITKHEGFKWVRRKYYYDAALNPVE